MNAIVERDNLRVFTAQRHENLIRALFFYEWRQHINFVFPFIEGNLEKLLTNTWRPPHGLDTVGNGPMHWLWIQMIGVAEGLSVIHNPQGNVFKNSERTGRGFHFDLKPANILITDKGQLKITDFGLSMITQVSAEDSSFAIFRGGAPKYQPPEMVPHKMAGFEADVAKTSYDIWSLACIIVECLNYILELEAGGSSQVLSDKLESEGSGQAFHHNGNLKRCIDKLISDIRGKDAVVTNSSGFDLWTFDVAGLLTSMFDCHPQRRPKSKEVFGRLTELQEEYGTQQDDELKIELKKVTRSQSLYPMENFDEIMFGYPDAHSFVDMFVIHVQALAAC